MNGPNHLNVLLLEESHKKKTTWIAINFDSEKCVLFFEVRCTSPSVKMLNRRWYIHLGLRLPRSSKSFKCRLQKVLSMGKRKVWQMFKLKWDFISIYLQIYLANVAALEPIA